MRRKSSDIDRVMMTAMDERDKIEKNESTVYYELLRCNTELRKIQHLFRICRKDEE